MCPDYEGIETRALLITLKNLLNVWICAPTMRGLKPQVCFKITASISASLDMCPDYEGIETLNHYLRHTYRVVPSLDMCPDYEGIETVNITHRKTP